MTAGLDRERTYGRRAEDRSAGPELGPHHGLTARREHEPGRLERHVELALGVDPDEFEIECAVALVGDPRHHRGGPPAGDRDGLDPHLDARHGSDVELDRHHRRGTGQAGIADREAHGSAAGRVVVRKDEGDGERAALVGKQREHVGRHRCPVVIDTQELDADLADHLVGVRHLDEQHGRLTGGGREARRRHVDAHRSGGGARALILVGDHDDAPVRARDRSMSSPALSVSRIVIVR